MIDNLIFPQRWPKKALILPRLQAHRGFWLEGKTENTLDAFRAAHAKKAFMSECDVRLTRDRVPVIFHDEDLQRMAERPERIIDLNFQELQSIFPAPSLEQVLRDPKSTHFLNIELKSKIAIDEPLERMVAGVVTKCQAESRVLFSSFNPMSLYRIQNYLPNVPRALLVSAEVSEENRIYLRKMWFAPFLKIHLLHLDQELADQKTIEKWRERRMPVAVYTVNGKQKIDQYLSWGAVSVITDTL